MTIVLETQGLEKHFGGLKVTRDLSLRVELGARHALIGPNGAGKTTVINLLTGVLRPDAGRILLQGDDITGLPVHRRVLRGLSLRAIRNNPLRAAAIGIPVNRRLIAIYTLAAFYAGVAGALFTQTTALASLDVFSFERSADLMLVLVIGGTGYLYGGLIGAVVFRMLQEVFSTITPQYWQFWIGLVLVVIVLVGRQRLHRWVLLVPNLVIKQVAGRKAVVAVPEGDA